jgi:hypothetical protein
VSCHAGDDAHAGKLGRQCERCHVTGDWNTIRSRVSAWHPPELAVLAASRLPSLWPDDRHSVAP